MPIAAFTFVAMTASWARDEPQDFSLLWMILLRSRACGMIRSICWSGYVCINHRWAHDAGRVGKEAGSLDRRHAVIHVGASVDHAQDPSQDNLLLPSAGEPRAAPFDGSPAGKPRSSLDFEQCGVTPDAVVTWAHDVFGNAVATANFQSLADNLVIDSVTELQHNATAWPSSTSPPPLFPILPIFRR